MNNNFIYIYNKILSLTNICFLLFNNVKVPQKYNFFASKKLCVRLNICGYTLYKQF